MNGTLGLLILGSIYAHLVAIVLVTYKIKHACLRWLCVFYPVIWLHFLFRIRFDIFSCALVWLPALAGVMAVIILLSVDIGRKRSGKNVPYYKARFVRPLLIVAIFIVALFAHSYSRRCADLYAIEKAKEIQAISKANGTCPSTLDGWTIDDKECYVMYGKFGPDFPIKYDRLNDEFRLEVYHSFDDRLYINGGVNKQLEAYQDFDGVRTNVSLK